MVGEGRVEIGQGFFGGGSGQAERGVEFSSGKESSEAGRKRGPSRVLSAPPLPLLTFRLPPSPAIMFTCDALLVCVMLCAPCMSLLARRSACEACLICLIRFRLASVSSFKFSFLPTCMRVRPESEHTTAWIIVLWGERTMASWFSFSSH